MRPIMILTVLAMAAAAPNVHAQPADQTTDKNSPCQGPDGKFATAAACKGAGPAPAASSVYRLDAKGRCRDDKGKTARAELCGAEANAPTKAGAAASKKAP